MQPVYHMDVVVPFYDQKKRWITDKEIFEKVSDKEEDSPSKMLLF